MSFLLRSLCVSFIIVLVLNYSQGFSLGYGTDSEEPEAEWEDSPDEAKRSLSDYYYALYPLQKRRRPSINQRNFAAPRGKRQDVMSLWNGRSLPVDEHLVPGEESQILDDGVSLDSHIRPKRAGDQGFLRIGRSPFLRIGRSSFLRIGRSPFLRIGRSPFLRIGRGSPFVRSQYQRVNRSPFLRIGRSPFIRMFQNPNMFEKKANDQIIFPEQYPEEESEFKRSFLRFGRPSKGGFLRFGRSNQDRKPSFLRFGRADKRGFLRIGRSDESFLRIGKSDGYTNEEAFDEAAVKNIDESMIGDETDTRNSMEKRGLRIGKRILNAINKEESSGLTQEELQLLMENKELLLQYMEQHPELFEESQSDDNDAYFAFPRQGRAMSFYFPRMGRSGEDNSNSAYCCPEGVRKVFTVGKGAIEICPNEKSCCPGYTEQNKVYQDIVITECAEESGLDKIRAYIGDE